MSEVILKAKRREDIGKKSTKHLRREGRVPAVYYTHGQEAIPISVDAKSFHAFASGEANVVDLELDKGNVLPSIIREIQWDPVTTEPLHVDFLGVKLDEKVVVEIPIHLTGTSTGVKNKGGVLQFLLRSLEIECLPREIPEHIEIDVTNLDVHESMTVGDLAKTDFTIITDPEIVIASVIPPRVEVETVEVEEVEEEGEEGEPEVVGKAKKEESETE